MTLRSKVDPSNFLLVANTHLFFQPTADNIRLIQMAIAMEMVRQTREKLLAVSEGHPGGGECRYDIL